MKVSLNFCWQKSNLQHTFIPVRELKPQKRSCLFCSRVGSPTIPYLGQAEGDAARDDWGVSSQREDVFVIGRGLHHNVSGKEISILLWCVPGGFCIAHSTVRAQKEHPAYLWGYTGKPKALEPQPDADTQQDDRAHHPHWYSVIPKPNCKTLHQKLISTSPQ